MPTLTSTHRRLFDVDLVPVAGARFQPTGFPDLGAARFQYPPGHPANPVGEWVDAILVESPQSMANRLEATGWDNGADQPVPDLAGLPYVRVVARDDGRYLTSSRTEAHRLAAAFVKDADFDGTSGRDLIKERLGLRDDTPMSQRDIAKAVFQLDPLCLVHGVFFADRLWPGQPKIARAVTAFVEAIDVKEAVSGGVKRDAVRHQLGDSVVGGTQEGYGTVPYHRVEFTAQRIVLHAAVDRAQLASYGLGDAATNLLETVALWELRTLLDGGLRLRTACDLRPVNVEIRETERDPDVAGALLPTAAELSDQLRSSVAACADLLGDGGPLTAAWDSGKVQKSQKGK